MDSSWKQLQQRLRDAGSLKESVSLAPGLELVYLEFAGQSFAIGQDSMGFLLQIHYCRSGQIVWETGDGNRSCLNPADFSLYPMAACRDSVLTFPTGQYTGLTLCLDLRQDHPFLPELLGETGPSFRHLGEKYCGGNRVAFLAGNEQTESIFQGFYDQPERLRLAYQKLKAAELLLYLEKLEPAPENHVPVYSEQQVAIIRQVHQQLVQNMGQRITIEQLAKQYLMNPTTLKAVFKSVYGDSLAAHIKTHRMERAAQLLRETQLSVAEISKLVGYDSQSKFTAAFKSVFQVLPRDYRKHS